MLPPSIDVLMAAEFRVQILSDTKFLVLHLIDETVNWWILLSYHCKLIVFLVLVLSAIIQRVHLCPTDAGRRRDSRPHLCLDGRNQVLHSWHTFCAQTGKPSPHGFSALHGSLTVGIWATWKVIS